MTSTRKLKKEVALLPNEPDAPFSTAPQEECRILSFSVGHGDCTLIEYVRNGSIAFRCLVDGGGSRPDALTEYLNANKRDPGAPDIDTLVLSHVDADHQGGLLQLVQEVTIGEYLGPCLPTFERLRWLFAPRVAEAVGRASDLERALEAAQVPVIYPLEGYVARKAAGRVVMSVLSPAARLLKRLSTERGPALTQLLARPPLPLQWLLDADDVAFDGDDVDAGRVFDGRTSLTPAEIRGRFSNGNLSVESGQDVGSTHGVEPEFFGNNVLNDTSLVLLIDVHLDGMHRRRLLLTGDQENWTYIAARHPNGLGVDVLKAPHHGGRVYVGDRQENIDSLYLWLRPRTVLVSANGRHKLPRAGFRDAIRKIGATAFCPNVRGVEALTPGSVETPGELSCFAAMGCRSDAAPYTRLVLKQSTELAERLACVQGISGAGVAPIVVLNQHITTPSEGVVRYTRAELERHAHWIAEQLRVHQREYTTRSQKVNDETAFLMRAQQPTISWSTLSAQARATGRHDLAHDPAPVIAFARAHRLFWCTRPRYARVDEPQELFRLPSNREIEGAWKWLSSIPRILLCSRSDPADSRRRLTLSDDEPLLQPRIEILRAADWTIVSGLLAAHLNVPAPVVEEEILPAFLPRLAHLFSLKVCSQEAPRRPRRESGSGGTYFLLEGRGATGAFPNVHSPRWMMLWNWKGPESRRPWKMIADLASAELLAGICEPRLRGNDLWTLAFDPISQFCDGFSPRIGTYIQTAQWEVVEK